MGLIDFIFNGNRKPSPTNQRLEPLVDEFVRLTTTVDGWNRGDARFTQQTFYTWQRCLTHTAPTLCY